MGLVLGDLSQDLFVAELLLVVLLVKLVELIDDLTFLESAVTDRGDHCVPLAETVFSEDILLVLRFKE